MTKTAIAIHGANGRMGRALIESALEDENVTMSAAFVREGSELIGIDAGSFIGGVSMGVRLTSLNQYEDECGAEVFIDFTLPDGLSQHIDWCVERRKAMVIGTTAVGPDVLAKIDEAARYIPIVFAPNMSVGVNVMINLLKTAAEAMGEQCDIEIVEAHHRFKQDAPSGTAMKFGEVIADTLGRDLQQCTIYGRQGIQAIRDRQTIAFSTLRAADIVGEHTVMFADIGERLEITHKATSRLTFAKGAVRAAKWLKSQPPGLYDMQTVLGLRK